MKKLCFLSSAVILLITCVMSCKKNSVSDPDPGGPGGPGEPAGYPTTEVQVLLPAGVTYDLSKTKLYTRAVKSPVAADGKSTIPFNEGGQELVYVLDPAGKPVLMGFVSAGNKQITIKSTAQALLHQALYLPWLPDTATRVFMQNTGTSTKLAGYYTEIEQSFKSDPSMLEKRTFVTALQKIVSTITEQRELVTGAKQQVYVATDELKSLMGIVQVDDQNVKVKNAGERRGHAFVYKTTYRTKSTRVDIIKDIRGSVTASQNMAVAPSSSVKEVVGEFATAVNYTAGGSSQITLPLESGEIEATYKVRVVGVGKEVSLEMTDAEEAKLEDMYGEMFALDLLMPIMLEAQGNNGYGYQFSEEDAKQFKDKTKELLAGVPATIDRMKEGKFALALGSFTDYLDKQPSHIWEELAGALVFGLENAKSRNGKKDWVASESSARGTVADMGSVLSLKKYILNNIENHRKLKDAVTRSNQIEEWEVIAKDNDVTVSPKNSSVTTLTNYPLTVTTTAKANANQVLWYKWTTSGKFGIIKTGTGEGVSMETDKSSVNFYCDKPTASIGDNNIETVLVTVYVKEGATLVEVGKDTATINIKKNKLEMRPGGVTLAPANGGDNAVRLYIVKADGTNDIVNSTALDYKVEWSTEGRYGKFNGSEVSALTAGNAINYTALDDQVKNATENITAKVYFKAKADTRWVLREEVKGSVKIMNDEKKIIRNVSLACQHGDTLRDNGNSITCMIESYAMVTGVADAKSYSIRFYDVPAPFSRSWEAGSSTVLPMLCANYVIPHSANQWAIEYDASWSVGPTASVTHLSCGSPVGSGRGMAEIIITLK